jgi:hypothetical protein
VKEERDRQTDEGDFCTYTSTVEKARSWNIQVRTIGVKYNDDNRICGLVVVVMSRDSSVGKVRDWTAVVRFPAGASDFPLLYNLHTDTWTYPASYTMGTRGSFLWGKAAVA